MQALRKEVSEVARLTDGEQGFTPWEVPELTPVTCTGLKGAGVTQVTDGEQGSTPWEGPELTPVTCPGLKGAGVRKRCGSSVVSANLFQLGGGGAVVE